MNFSGSLVFHLFLLCIVAQNLGNFYYLAKNLSFVFCLNVIYKNILISALVWDTKRKLKKIGRSDWAESLKTSANDDWEQN